MKRILVALAAALLAMPAIAQEMMPAPKELGWIAFLNGSFTADLTMHEPDGKTSKAKGRTSSRLSLGGMYLEGDFTMKMGGMDFFGKQLLTYDAQKKEFIGWWFDSAAPGTMEMHGNVSGNMLRMVSTPTPMPGMPEKVVMRVTYTKMGASQVGFKLEMKQGEAWAPMMSGTFTRVRRAK